MIGHRISDPAGVESIGGSVTGLGLLPVDTRLAAEKTTVVRRATTPGGASFDAYEIHHGVTSSPHALAPFAILDDGRPEGVREGRVIGTYLHGAFENAAVCREIFGVRCAAARHEARRTRGARRLVRALQRASGGMAADMICLRISRITRRITGTV